MNRRAMTLVELTVVMVLGIVLLLAITCLFIADLNFRAIVNNEIAATQEATCALNQMTGILRFGRVDSPDMTIVPGELSLVRVDISGWPLSIIVTYKLFNGNLRYTPSNGVVSVIASDITDFTPSIDAANECFIVSITVQKGAGTSARSVTLTKTIRSLSG